MVARSACPDWPWFGSRGWKEPHFAGHGEGTGSGERPPPRWNGSAWHNEWACKPSLDLTRRDTLHLATLVDNVFSHYNYLLCCGLKIRAVGTCYHCLKGIGFGAPPVAGVVSHLLSLGAKQSRFQKNDSAPSQASVSLARGAFCGSRGPPCQTSITGSLQKELTLGQ